MWSFVAKGPLWKSDWSRFTDHPIKLYAWPTNVNSVQDWDKLLVADLVAIHSLTHVFVGQLSFYDGFVEVTERHLFHLHRHLFNSKLWSHPMQFYSMIDESRSARFSQLPKNIKHGWYFWYFIIWNVFDIFLARRTSHENFATHERKRLRKLPSPFPEAFRSALSSRVRWALNSAKGSYAFITSIILVFLYRMEHWVMLITCRSRVSSSIPIWMMSLRLERIL